MVMREQKYRLPYVDNALAILITLAINVVVTFIFFWPNGVDFFGVIQDTIICVVITVAINMLIIYLSMKKLRARGAMPTQVPESRLMQRLPKNPAALGLIYIIFFGLVTVGINTLFLWFFEMETMAFIPWITFKLIYATVLTVKVVEYCIFRYVQLDWALDKEGGTVKHLDIELKPVKDPLPKISVFAAMFGSVTSSVAMNIIIGTITGGVFVAAESMVIIAPNTIEGMPTTGFVFGFITGLLTTNAIVKAVNSGIIASVLASGKEDTGLSQDPPPLSASDRRFSWMPKARVPFTLLMCAGVMVFSIIMLPSIMWLFGLSILNFFQYTAFMIIYSSLISKPLGYVITQRLSQPDHVFSIINKHARKETRKETRKGGTT